MSYLLGHVAVTERVDMTPQGYVNIADLIKWLYHDIKVHVTMADITHIAEYDLKARYRLVNGQICAVNGHSLSLPLLTFKPYNHRIGGHPRYLVHETYYEMAACNFKRRPKPDGKKSCSFEYADRKTGLQQKSKPTIAIYVDVVRA